MQTANACADGVGEWFNATSDGWSCPFLLPVAYRFHCSDAPFRHFELQPGCQQKGPLRTSDVLGPNRTAFFLGDSLSAQHAIAFACRMLQELSTSGSDRARTVEMPRWSSFSPAWLAAAHPPHAAHTKHAARAQAHCYVVNGRRACHASSWPTAQAVAERLIRSRNVVAGDIVIMNDGLHYGEAASLAMMRELAVAFANTTSELAAARRGGIRFAWRETSPQAFGDLPNGSYVQAYRTYGRNYTQGCVPLERTARPDSWARGIAALAAADLDVVKVWHSTASQWDQHLASRTPYVARTLDCTHFCQPSGVMEEWVNATLRTFYAARPRYVGAREDPLGKALR